MKLVFPCWNLSRLFGRNVAVSLIMVALATAAAQSWADEAPPVAEGKSAKSLRSYVRVKTGDDGKNDSMDTIVLSFKPKGKELTDLQVDLIGAIHVGEPEYYEALNKRFDTYDVVLYELVAPEGTRVRKEDAEKGPRSAIGGLQNGLQGMLGLTHQLQCIDYSKANFVHADMTPEEFDKSMTERGESWSGMFFKSLGYGLAAQHRKGANAPGELDLIGALFSRNREYKLRNIFAGQMQSMEGQLAAIGGKDGSTIIEQRNGKAFSVLRKQIDEGKKKIGIFYGAGHFGDMEKRLVNDFGLEAADEEWLAAWRLREPLAEKKEPAPEKKERSGRGRQKAPADAN
jgi:hypothetical protein